MSQNNSESNPTGLLLSNRAYDVLKTTVTLVLPAAGALYFTLSSIWNFPKAEEVVGTLAAITTFFGVLLGLSSRTFNNSDARFDGSIVVSENTPGVKTMSLELHSDPENLDQQKQVTFKVESTEQNR